MNVELLYFDDCPGHTELRERLPRLLEQAGVKTTIQERRIDSEDEAIAERFLGSPTLRVDGRDVDPPAHPGASSPAECRSERFGDLRIAWREDYGLRCRLYPNAEGFQRRRDGVRPQSRVTR
jgi:hypothetical protein